MGGNPPVTEDITANIHNYPGYAWQSYVWRGWVSEVPNPPPHSIELPAVDLNSIVMDLSRSSSNIAETIATFKSTTSLFRRPAQFLKHASKNGIKTSRKPLKELRVSLDTAGKTWLTGTYGYLPLISDLIEISALCLNPSKSLEKLKRPVTRDIRSTNSDSYSTERPVSMDPHYFSQKVQVVRSLSRLIRIEGTPNPSFQAMSLANQMATYLGLNDFGRLAWELVPFSFVFDWFSNLGRSVASTSALNGHLAYCDIACSSALKTQTLTSYMTNPAPETTYTNTYFQTRQSINVVGGSCTVEDIMYVRSPRGEADLSGATFTNGLNAYRTTTGFALLLGSLRHLAGW